MAINSMYKVAFGGVSLGVFAMALAGCGLNVSSPPPSTVLPSFGGVAFGGPSPVVGATVNLYATGMTGYGSTATLLGTTTTNSSGAFTYGAVAPCPANTQAYITATGGNPGSGTNPNYLLMAAIGPCAGVNANTFIKITEASTVVAAYALRPFTTITGGLTPTVNIGAPANNSAATGVCTTVANVTTTCTAAGLAHAFANAANLINAVGTLAALPTGQIYQVTPSNANGVVPTAMLNSLANSVEACVNSSGGAAGDSGTPCGNLFTNTTAPVSNAAAPTNTLQAMLNVAQYPALTPATVAALYNMAPATSFYTPALTSAPTDFSLAIAYAGPTVAGVVSAITPTINNPSGFGSGTGYQTVPLVTLSGGGFTTPATATASLGLTYFSVSTAFAGLCTDQANTTVAVTITNGTTGGTGAAATETYAANGAPMTGTVTASGSGYTALPTFTILCTTNGGTTVTQPVGTQKIKGFGVVSFNITNPGAGYTSAPTVTIGAPAGGSGSPPVVQAVATATTAAQSLPAPYSLSLDANDNVYVGWQNVAGTTGANSFVTGNTANGSTLFMSTPSSTFTAPRGSMTDTLGHYWVAENNTAAGGVYGFNTADGSTFMSLTGVAAPFSIGVDKANNVWYGVAPVSLPQNLYELQQSSTPAAYTNVTFANVPLVTNGIRTIQFNASQNVFFNIYSTTTNMVGAFANMGTATAPAYGTTTGGLVTASLTGSTGSGMALDAQSNMWAATSTGLYEAVPTFGGTNGTTVTTLTPSTNMTDNLPLPGYDAVDGVGNIWVGNNGAVTAGQTLVQFVPGTATANAFAPCYAPTGTTTCAATNLNQPQRVQVDSSGSVWITSVGNGRVYQMLGTGAPTWPQLSYSNPGVMPQ